VTVCLPTLSTDQPHRSPTCYITAKGQGGNHPLSTNLKQSRFFDPPSLILHQFTTTEPPKRSRHPLLRIASGCQLTTAQSTPSCDRTNPFASSYLDTNAPVLLHSCHCSLPCNTELWPLSSARRPLHPAAEEALEFGRLGRLNGICDD
jgi:hypothetical protein